MKKTIYICDICGEMKEEHEFLTVTISYPSNLEKRNIEWERRTDMTVIEIEGVEFTKGACEGCLLRCDLLRFKDMLAKAEMITKAKEAESVKHKMQDMGE